MQKTIKNAHLQLDAETISVFADELFGLHQLPQVQEDLDRVHKLVMLTDDERFPQLDKQTWWESYKRLKITTTCFQTGAHPETVFEVEIQL